MLFQKAWSNYDGEGTLLTVKRDEPEFELYYVGSQEMGRRVAQELADLMEKPLE